MRTYTLPHLPRRKRKARKKAATSFVTSEVLPYGAGDRGRTDTVSLPLDFESSTSANSITPA